MEKGTLHELQMKKKKMKHNLCYVGLVVLTIFLLLPVAFRLFIRDPDEEKTKEEEKKVYISLSCIKGEESISSTFLNDKPQSIMYKVKGNKVSTNNPDEVDENAEDSTVSVASSDNQTSGTMDSNTVNNNVVEGNNSTSSSVFGDNETVVDVLSKIIPLQYDSNEDVSIIKMNYSYISANPDYNAIFGTIKGQETFFQSRGFSCTQVEF